MSLRRCLNQSYTTVYSTMGTISVQRFFPLLLELGGGFLLKLLRNVHQKTSKKRAELLR